MSEGKRILIVGGVAGGASCAARARRLSEDAKIIVFERGPHVSFANCGLPYYIGNVIKKERELLVATPELFRRRFNIEVRVRSEVVAIDRARREIHVRDLNKGHRYKEPYDALVLSPGAAPLRPAVPGVDLPGIFTLRNVPDSKAIIGWIEASRAKRALVVGGGFIGLEMTENLLCRGMDVIIVEMQSQIMPALDPEIASPVQLHLREKGVTLLLDEAVSGFNRTGDGPIEVRLRSGETLTADIVILAAGVRPEVKLAKEARLEIGQLGGIRVDDQMRTSDPHIWAVGDAVEVRDFVTGHWTLVPLAGPANRQGRIAADVIMGREARFRGVQATSICSVMGLTVASTGPSEKSLRNLGLWDSQPGYEKVYLHPLNHAGYYPGATSITMKVIFRRQDGRLVSVQAVGKEGVDKRVDVMAMAIQMGATVFDLEEAELCYAPQFGSAKDPVNIAGMTASNVMRGDTTIVHWDELPVVGAFILDVRDPRELRDGSIEGSCNIPLNELRERLGELPKDREILVYCQVGQRSYFASRLLAQKGYRVRNLSGGYLLISKTRGIK